MAAPLSIPGAGEGDDEGDNTVSCAVATAKMVTTKNIEIFKQTDSAIIGIRNSTAHKLYILKFLLMMILFKLKWLIQPIPLALFSEKYLPSVKTKKQKGNSIKNRQKKGREEEKKTPSVLLLSQPVFSKDCPLSAPKQDMESSLNCSWPRPHAVMLTAQSYSRTLARFLSSNSPRVTFNDLRLKKNVEGEDKPCQVLKKTKREKMREVPSRAAEMGKENAAPSGGHGTGAKSCAGSGKSCAEAQNAAAANTASTKALITLTCAICEGEILLRFQGL
nr:hypothetical protein A4A49_42526 [Ipomoea batatas]